MSKKAWKQGFVHSLKRKKKKKSQEHQAQIGFYETNQDKILSWSFSSAKITS
jgi:hypothetical protein